MSYEFQEKFLSATENFRKENDQELMGMLFNVANVHDIYDVIMGNAAFLLHDNLEEPTTKIINLHGKITVMREEIEPHYHNFSGLCDCVKQSKDVCEDYSAFSSLKQHYYSVQGMVTRVNELCENAVQNAQRIALAVHNMTNARLFTVVESKGMLFEKVESMKCAQLEKLIYELAVAVGKRPDPSSKLADLVAQLIERDSRITIAMDAIEQHVRNFTFSTKCVKL